jgi:hypothetical protein
MSSLISITIESILDPSANVIIETAKLSLLIDEISEKFPMVATVDSILFETSASTVSGLAPTKSVTVTTKGKLISGNKVKGSLVTENNPNTIIIKIPIKTVIGRFTLYELIGCLQA